MCNSGGKNEKICHHEDIACVENALERSSVNLEELCGCLPECNKIDYNFEIIEDKLNRSFRNYRFTEISASIQFIDDEFIAFKRFESFGGVSLLSKIGGLLGLFLGISLLSIVEVIYFVTLRLFDDLCLKLANLKS